MSRIYVVGEKVLVEGEIGMEFLTPEGSEYAVKLPNNVSVKVGKEELDRYNDKGTACVNVGSKGYLFCECGEPVKAGQKFCGDCGKRLLVR